MKKKEKHFALTGNRTRASRVAGENSTTEPSVLHTPSTSYFLLSCRPSRCSLICVSLTVPRSLLHRLGSMMSRTSLPSRQIGLRTLMTLEQLGKHYNIQCTHSFVHLYDVYAHTCTYMHVRVHVHWVRTQFVGYVQQVVKGNYV